MAPGPLRKAAGFYYQEFSNLAQPVPLTTELGSGHAAASWAEFLIPETAATVARYEHPFLGRFPAVTRNRHGKGVFTYEGTVVPLALQIRLVGEALTRSGISTSDSSILPVRVRHGWNQRGQRLHYYLNFSGSEANAAYRYASGRDLLTGRQISQGGAVVLEPYGVAIVREE